MSRASTTAIAAIEAAGGSVMTRFYTPSSIKRVLRGLTDPIKSLQSQPTTDSTAVSPGAFTYRLPDPTSRKDIEYYRDPAHRGYLSHLVKEGETPSLFFKTPGMFKRAKKGSKKAKGASKAVENKIW